MFLCGSCQLSVKRGVVLATHLGYSRRQCRRVYYLCSLRWQLQRTRPCCLDEKMQWHLESTLRPPVHLELQVEEDVVGDPSIWPLVARSGRSHCQTRTDSPGNCHVWSRVSASPASYPHPSRNNRRCGIEMAVSEYWSAWTTPINAGRGCLPLAKHSGLSQEYPIAQLFLCRVENWHSCRRLRYRSVMALDLPLEHHPRCAGGRGSCSL